MPSSKKTANLLLNSWLGSDKPKKDDFNEDNQILDRSIGGLRTQVGELEQEVELLQEQVQEELGEGLEGLREQLEKKLEAVNQALGTRVGAAESGLSAHKADTAAHVTPAEKARWDSGAMEVGTYTGNSSSTSSQKITLGYRPRFGIVYAMSMPPLSIDGVSKAAGQHFAFIGGEGSSGGVTCTDTGFEAHSTNAMLYDVKYCLNEQGVPYVYMVWR